MPRSNTQTIIDALRFLARDIESGDGVANAAVAEAADRMEQMQEAIAGLIGYALTSRSHSKEWLQGMAGYINAAAEVLDDPDRAVVEGDGLRVKRGEA